ncbi:hypothetical protein AB0F72_31670 [Actinoplanes sp. NPDC023936]|uniref:hypothetical protein n=1 Tax=Actinoplanes sp. NPDC023936 TaxID=3154910 RepID=UPI00340B19AC
MVGKIDFSVEPLVREALGAVVGKDLARLQQALGAFTSDEAAIHGLNLATAVSLYVLYDLNEGVRSTNEELAEIAGEVATAEKWVGPAEDEVNKYLQAAHSGTRVDQILPMERVIILAYVIAANLLASYCDEGEHWWDFLDRAEAAIEATPER